MQENTLPETVVTEPKFFRLKLLVALFLVVSATILGTYTVLSAQQNKNGISNEATPSNLAQITESEEGNVENTPVKISPITSSYKAYVDVSSDKLVTVYPVDKKYERYSLPEYGEVFSGGALGFGDTGVVLAPDLEKFAILSSGKVTIHAVDKSVKIELPIEDVQYITGWSLNSSKLLVYARPNTIKSRFESEGMMAAPDIITLNSTNALDGFILIDFVSGTIHEMSELDGMLVHAWSSDDSLIGSIGFGQNEEFVYYSLSEKSADRKKVSIFNEVFGSQMSFSRDGKKWATVTSVAKNDIDSAQVTLGNFPNFGDIGKVVVGWARRQGPVLSPSGEVLALYGYEVLNGPTYLYLYTGDQGDEIKQVTEGRPRFWIDNSQLIFTREGRVFMYNIDTKTTAGL